MSFILKTATDKQVINSNLRTNNDFNHPELVESDWLVKDMPFGQAKMKEWVFDGIRMVYSDWHFQQAVALEWESSWETVTLYFNLRGDVSIGNTPQSIYLLGNKQQNMFYGSERSGLFKTDDLRMQAFKLHFNRDAFLRIAGEGSENLKRFAEMVAGQKTSVLSDVALPVDIPTQNAIAAILHCKFSNELKRIFLMSKAMELLVLQADAHAWSVSKPVYIKSDYDRDRIMFAREYMLQNIDTPPSIPELARMAAINEFKLKKGYKELFGNTIFGDLSDVRLERARLLLAGKDQSVASVAYQLGYATVQHFSYVFKKKFGFTPKQVQRK